MDPHSIIYFLFFKFFWGADNSTNQEWDVWWNQENGLNVRHELEKKNNNKLDFSKMILLCKQFPKHIFRNAKQLTVLHNNLYILIENFPIIKLFFTLFYWINGVAKTGKKAENFNSTSTETNRAMNTKEEDPTEPPKGHAQYPCILEHHSLHRAKPRSAFLLSSFQTPKTLSHPSQVQLR